MESYYPIVIRFHLFIIITIKPLVIFYLLSFLWTDYSMPFYQRQPIVVRFYTHFAKYSEN